MSARPFVSVILGNRNYGRFLEQCINSVLAQTLGDFELIIVDDASTDDSRKVIAAFNDSRIQPVLREKQGGQAAVFNSGFERARGEIVAFLDSDDWWKPEKLAEVARWHQFTNAEYGLMQHNVDVWHDGHIYPFKTALYSGDLFAEMQESLQINAFVGSSGLMARRVILQEVFPIPVELFICADAYITRTSFTFGPVVSIPKSLSYYRRHSNLVFGNQQFDNRDFNQRWLFPALDAFYQHRQIAFRISDLIMLRPPNLCSAFLTALIRAQWRWLDLQYPRMAVFGAGKHSRWLEVVTADTPGPRIVGILDDVSTDGRFWGLCPVKPSNWNPLEADAILLSSDCHQLQMATRCEKTFGRQVPCVDLYEDLPPGPYAKQDY